MQLNLGKLFLDDMVDQNNTGEERIQVLKDRFTWLKIHLEATAQQISILGSELNLLDQGLIKSLGKHPYKLPDKDQVMHKWIDNVIEVMEFIHHPVSMKEIAVVLFASQDSLRQSTIYYHVKKSIDDLVQNGMVVRCLTNQNKFSLKISFNSN